MGWAYGLVAISTPGSLTDAAPEVDQLGRLRSQPLRYLLVFVVAEIAAAFEERYETFVCPCLLSGMSEDEEHLQVAQDPLGRSGW